MGLPSGWNATNSDESVRYETKVGATPAEHHVQVNCEPIEHDDGKVYPQVQNVSFRPYGRNCKGESHSDNFPPNRVGARAFLKSSDEEHEGEENTVIMTWLGRDSNNKLRHWSVTVELDLCW
jgi:hypothetical protein